MNSSGTKTVTVSLGGKTASFDITVTAAGVTLTSIKVTDLPTKTNYLVGEAFEPTGLVVTGTYSDGTTKAETGYILSGADTGSSGPKTVTVTLSGKTAAFTITVNPALVSIAVTRNPTKNAYVIGETFNRTGLEVTGTYSDGTAKNETGYTLSTPDMSTAGTKTVTVTLKGKTTSFTIAVVHPSDIDTDGDGLPDWWESENGLDPNDPAGNNGALGDPDNDGLTNKQEFEGHWSGPVGVKGTKDEIWRTDPKNRDTDGDGYPDGWEVNNGYEPTDRNDHPGRDADSDGDGFTDGEELDNGTDPTNPDDYPPGG
jgi:DNA-binding protein YbaB